MHGFNTNSKFKNWNGCQSIYNICILNYCKLTAASTATDGGVEKLCRVFALQKLEVHQCTGGTLMNRNKRIPKMLLIKVGNRRLPVDKHLVNGDKR